MREFGARLLRCLMQPAIGKGVGAVEQNFRRTVPVGMPVLPDQIQIAVDAAGSHNHHRRFGFKCLATVCSHARAAAHGAGSGVQAFHPVLAEQGESISLRMLQQALHQRLHQPVPGAPHHVPARYGVAAAPGLHAAFHPERQGQKGQALPAQPVVHILQAVMHIVLGPAAWPVIDGTVAGKIAKAQPVLQRLFGRVLDALASLLRRVHQQDAAKAFLRQAAQVLFGIAVQQQHAPPLVQQAQGAHNACQSGSDDQDVAPMPLHVVSRKNSTVVS